jgi:hypothetical protein
VVQFVTTGICLDRIAHVTIKNVIVVYEYSTWYVCMYVCDRTGGLYLCYDRLMKAQIFACQRCKYIATMHGWIDVYIRPSSCLLIHPTSFEYIDRSAKMNIHRMREADLPCT